MCAMTNFWLARNKTMHTLKLETMVKKYLAHKTEVDRLTILHVRIFNISSTLKLNAFVK